MYRHRFSFALSAEKALVYLDQHASECVLILSDINMPGMSGLELLRHIRQTHPLAPPTIMMITAYGDMDTHTKAIQHGADDFLTKPLDFKTLKEKFRSIYEGQGSGRG